MDNILGYIRNIGFFLILVSIVCNALPDNTYKKYCKLFCGLVLVVLVIAPFNEVLNYEGDISDIFLNKSYQSQMMELEANLKWQEEEQMESILAQYEEKIKEELAGVAKEEGLYIHDININYEYSDKDSSQLELKSVDIKVTDNAPLEYEEKDYMELKESDDINLDEIHIDDIEINIDKGGDNESGIGELSPGDRPKVLKFIEKVAGMLGIETYMINVTMKQ